VSRPNPAKLLFLAEPHAGDGSDQRWRQTVGLPFFFPTLSHFATPFDVDAEIVSEEVQMEVLDLQCDTILKQKYIDVGVSDFYKFLSREKYPKAVSAAAELMAMFGSTYTFCKQFFSSMKNNKFALWSRLTDE